ncbi:hypothetical protein ONZ45_g17989 [Pleurotus djamor]|nr:hypothetical protein ONZ45_g17989 [Pleurotus djamor]
MTIDKPRVLLVDSYDSFAHNLASLCRSSIPNCSIYIIKNDQLTIEQLLPHLDLFSAIIVGPGPGSPDNPQDIGIVKDLWKIPQTHILPIFGVCLGLQSLAVEHGAELHRLKTVKHGQISNVHHSGNDLFASVGQVQAVRYHSLHVRSTPSSSSLIEELGWADDGEENGKVVMAIKHRYKPFWAVQYHPESVCTNGGGFDVVCNFWNLAQAWARKNNRVPMPWNHPMKHLVGPSWPNINPHSAPPSPTQRPAVSTRTLRLPDHSITSICELLDVGDESKRFALLDSAARPGRFSIVASLTPSSPQITYFVGDSWLTVSTESESNREELAGHDIWTWLASYMRRRRAHGGNPDIPFWGGLIGHLSYELGVSSLNVPLRPSASGDRHPDVNLVHVERSIVHDNIAGTTHVQSLLPEDDEWLDEMCSRLSALQTTPLTPDTAPLPKATSITRPDKSTYIARINHAKESLFAGDSYELCLTAPTHITLPSVPSTTSTSWQRYKQLRKNNPAPHSAYLRLHPSTLLSSSPERFLSYSRPPGTVCQLRPIKGTVRKSPEITRAVAEELLAGSKKEVAENLMIVDLIRHDLHGVVGEDVAVTQFCKVEEYETVWQLVSVIEGKLPSGFDDDSGAELGWEVLSQSLPPGSMTGAPKKRSVEILQNLEDDHRSIYSGVFGYCCFKYQDVSAGSHVSDLEHWRIGAGGAITALSDADAEWDEMLVKLESVLRAFGISG